MSANGFIELKDKQSLEKFIEDSRAHPSILFKHSNTCGISSLAYREMSKVQHPVGLITVQKARQLSDELEQRYGLPHESPQVLIVRGGELLWDASHSRVRAATVEEALASVISKQ
jgi:monothiol bacilliredoxin